MQKVLIDGTVYFDRDNEVSGRAAKQAEKQKLIEKEKQQPRAAEAAAAGGVAMKFARHSVRCALAALRAGDTVCHPQRRRLSGHAARR